MSRVTQILHDIGQGERGAAERLLPLVYEELRQLAAARLANEKPGQTLQATALVHEAYLRLVHGEELSDWNSRGHFFGAAAEAMRRILIENARRLKSAKHGGQMARQDLAESQIASSVVNDQLLDLDEALDRLADEDPSAAQLVKLRYFAGLTIKEAAEVLQISPRAADFLWAFARSWLRRELSRE